MCTNFGVNFKIECDNFSSMFVFANKILMKNNEFISIGYHFFGNVEKGGVMPYCSLLLSLLIISDLQQKSILF
jgi:hypothetical protein